MNIVDRAKNIIMTPKTEWPAIAAEQPNVGQIVSGYVIPLALIPAIAAVLGYGLIGRGMAASFTWGIAMAIITFVAAVVGVYLTAFVIDMLIVLAGWLATPWERATRANRRPMVSPIVGGAR